MGERRDRACLLDDAGAVAAQETFDHGPAERTDVIGACPRVARIAEGVRFGIEQLVVRDLHKDFLVAPERQASGGAPPGVEFFGSAIAPLASIAVETVRIAARARRAPAGVVRISLCCRARSRGLASRAQG